jgi:hypothetical protein
MDIDSVLGHRREELNILGYSHSFVWSLKFAALLWMMSMGALLALGMLYKLIFVNIKPLKPVVKFV